ncbi:MAG TPA: TerC family protein [Hyphomicrobiaceae bacterium]|nr:TerC family protein [Hyphomicrobiaceae bacterium]
MIATTSLVATGSGFDISALLAGDITVIGQILQIIWIDLVLSGDNAVVIALACRSLPDRRQRRAGIILGAGVAILLRIVFAGVVTQLLAIPYLKLIGGVLLLWIAVKLLIGEDEDDPNITAHDRLWKAVMTIAMADALMSLDNVIAVAAVAKGSIALIAFGVALSIPLIIWGSTLVLALIGRFPAVIWLGAALLGWISGELIASEGTLQTYLAALSNMLTLSVGTLHVLAGLAGVAITLLLGWLFIRLKKRQPA